MEEKSVIVLLQILLENRETEIGEEGGEERLQIDERIERGTRKRGGRMGARDESKSTKEKIKTRRTKIRKDQRRKTRG